MRYEIAFGFGFDRHGVAIDAQHSRESLKMIMVEACTRFGGCNLVISQGAWLDPAGTLVLEASGTLTILVPNDPLFRDRDIRMDEFAEYVRNLLDQHSVIVSRIETSARTVDKG